MTIMVAAVACASFFPVVRSGTGSLEGFLVPDAGRMSAPLLKIHD